MKAPELAIVSQPSPIAKPEETDKTVEFLPSELSAILHQSMLSIEDVTFDAPTTPAPWPPEGMDLSQLVIEDDDGEIE